jgi:hypothetical protein
MWMIKVYPVATIGSRQYTLGPSTVRTGGVTMHANGSI